MEFINTPEIEKQPSDSFGIIFIGPSGAGKTTLADMLTETSINGHSFKKYKPYTTRARRKNEGEEYHFVDDDSFNELMKSNDVLFGNEWHGNHFLTMWPENLGNNEHYVYIYAPAAAQKIKEHFPNHKIIQILPDYTEKLEKIMLERDPDIRPIELRKRLEAIPIEIDEGARVADDVFVNAEGVDNSFDKLTEVIEKYLR